MNYDLSDLQTIYPKQLWLTLSPEDKEYAWQQTGSQSYSTPAARWRAFLNYLSLKTFVNFLKEDSEFSNILQIPNWNDLPTFWEVVNGCTITLNETKLVLIPTDKSNMLEFEVPVEWVNIPNWAGQYYLAVQVNLEQSCLRVWGYTTHQQLNNHATLEDISRTYCLDRDYLIEDLNIMWVAREHSQTHFHVPPLTTLTSHSEKLLHIFSQPNIHSPRLYGDFDEWCTLIASDDLRRKLHKYRTSELSNNNHQTTNLSLWLQDVFEAGWQHIDALLNPQQTILAAQFRDDTAITHRVQGAKLIDLGMQLGNKSVVLLMGLSPEIDDKISMRVQLYPTKEEYYLPACIKLSLLTNSGAVIQEVVSRSHDNYIQLKRFKLPSGKSFMIQLVLGDIVIKETFTLDVLIGKSP